MKPFVLISMLVFAGNNVWGAAQIHDNGAPDHINALSIADYLQADDVTFTEDTRIDSVTFADFELTEDFAGAFFWQIFSNAPGNGPGSLLHSGYSANLARIETGITTFGFKEMINSFDIPSVYLPPGTYWLALHNGPLTDQAPKKVFWEMTAQRGALPSRGAWPPFTDGWFENVYASYPSDFAFQLNGAIAPRVTAFKRNGGAPQITFSTIVNENYMVEYKNTLKDAVWLPLAGAEFIAGTGSDVQVTDSDPAVQNRISRFYRARLLVP